MRPSDEAPQALEGLDSTGVIVVVSEEIPVAEPAMQTAVEQRRVQEWLTGLRENASIVDRRDVVLQPADEEGLQLPGIF